MAITRKAPTKALFRPLTKAWHSFSKFKFVRLSRQGVLSETQILKSEHIKLTKSGM